MHSLSLACPEEKNTECGTYVDINPSFCEKSWFTEATGSYVCQKSCGMCQKPSDKKSNKKVLTKK